MYVGVQMAERRSFDARVTVGSIQTLQSARLEEFLTHLRIGRSLFGDDIGPLAAVIFDECHHVTVDNSYASLIEAVKAVYPDCVFLGCTATPFRSDTHSMLDMLPTCTFQRSIPDMIEAGWLCPVTWRPLKLPVDLGAVKVSMTSEGRDYNASQVTDLYSPQSAYIAEKVKGMVEKRPTIVFAASVEHAYQLAAAFVAVDMQTGVIEATMNKRERYSLLLDWKAGSLQVVVNVGVLTEGFDYTPIVPNIEGLAAVVVARPTMSPSLYLQMIGRGTRLKPGTYKDCLIIDVCGNANLLETKQILLPKAMPTVSEEEIEEFNDENVDWAGMRPEKERRKARRDQAPYTVHINDGDRASWLAWGVKNGIYYADLGESVTGVLLPDPAGSGLFLVRTLHKQGYGEYQWSRVLDQADTLPACMQHINLLVAQAGNRRLLDKNARWRGDTPSERQLQVLNKKTREVAVEQQWNKGEVGLALTWQFIRPTVERYALHGS